MKDKFLEYHAKLKGDTKANVNVEVYTHEGTCGILVVESQVADVESAIGKENVAYVTPNAVGGHSEIQLRREVDPEEIQRRLDAKP